MPDPIEAAPAAPAPKTAPKTADPVFMSPDAPIEAAPAAPVEQVAAAPVVEPMTMDQAVADFDKADAERVAPPPGQVMVRILKRGDRKIFTGETCPNDPERFPTYRFGDIVPMPRSIAEIYEDDDKGWVEIQP